MVVIVMGAAGAGKTTVGGLLARTLGWAFDDADDLHPPANVAKMAAGVALSDADREPWLERLRARIAEHLAAGRDAVVACSALKARYRERLAVDPHAVRFFYLRAPAALLAERVARRRGHFLGPALLQSQLEALEEPDDALTLDAAESPGALVAHIRAALGR